MKNLSKELLKPFLTNLFKAIPYQYNTKLSIFIDMSYPPLVNIMDNEKFK